MGEIPQGLSMTPGGRCDNTRISRYTYLDTLRACPKSDFYFRCSSFLSRRCSESGNADVGDSETQKSTPGCINESISDLLITGASCNRVCKPNAVLVSQGFPTLVCDVSFSGQWGHVNMETVSTWDPSALLLNIKSNWNSV